MAAFAYSRVNPGRIRRIYLVGRVLREAFEDLVATIVEQKWRMPYNGQLRR